MKTIKTFVLLAAIVIAAPCLCAADETPIAVTSSYIECAVREVTSAPVLLLTQPGTCPGHFDLRPSDAQELAKAKLLFCFDFQKDMDKRFSAFKDLTVIPLNVKDGMMIPNHYGNVRRQIADALEARDPASTPTIEKIMDEAKRADDRNSKIGRAKVRGLIGQSVIASERQKRFCSWLWMKVAGTLPAPDKLTPETLTELVALKDIAFVIGNTQEGDGAAKLVAEKLGVPCVMFSNFPKMTPDESTFAQLFQKNIDTLTAAARRVAREKREQTSDTLTSRTLITTDTLTTEPR